MRVAAGRHLGPRRRSPQVDWSAPGIGLVCPLTSTMSHVAAGIAVAAIFVAGGFALDPRMRFLRNLSASLAFGIAAALLVTAGSSNNRAPTAKSGGRIFFFGYPFASARRKTVMADKGTKMSKRRWIFLLIIVVIVGSIAAGTRYYLSKCHGMDACAAADAESHERDKPSEPQ